MTKTFPLADPLADHRGFQTRFLDGMLKFNVALGVAFMVLYSGEWINLQPEQRYLLGFLTLFFAVMTLVLQRKPGTYVPIALSVCVSTFLLFMQALLVAQYNELRIVWFIMSVGAGYLLLGRRMGMLTAAGTILLVWGTNHLHATPYTRQALLVYTAVLLVMCYGYHTYVGYAMELYRHVLRREALFRLLTEDTAEVVWRIDRNNVLSYVSPADERLRGYPAQDVVGRPAEEMFTAEGAQILRQALRSDSHVFLAPVRCRDGSERWMEIMAERELDDQGALAGHHGRGRDVTERLRLQAELEQHRGHLEDMVRERTSDLSVAKDAAEAAARAKNIFLSNISHELRTPLTVIVGMSELARARVAEPRSQQLLDQVLSQARKLAALITDLIDYAALAAKRMEMRRSPLLIAPLMHQVQTSLHGAASAKGIALSLDIAPEVAQTPFVGDARRLQQVLMQLTDNAVKFTSTGHVTLRALAPEPAGADAVLLRFEVEDTGIGIAPDDQWRLFNAFEQADGTATRQHEGTGLGLALCKLLVQAMAGSIRVTSQPGQGSTFHFSVRLESQPVHSGQADPHRPQQPEQRAIGASSIGR